MGQLVKTAIFIAILTLTNAEPLFLNDSVSAISLPSSESEHKNLRVPEPRFRLPSFFIPYHYEVKVRPILENIPGDLPQYSAPGSVTIYGACSSATTKITLHSQVDIDETTVKVTNLATSADVPVTGHSYDEEKTFYIIELGAPLALGIQYSIYVEYVAEVYTGDSLEGMYRNHYDDPITGETKYSVATQLQSFGARKVFPCLDEPALKATFGITLGRRSNYSSICNSPLLSTTPIPELEGWFWDEFNATVKMPTYLVAIIISDFTYDEADSSIYPKPVRTYGPKHLIDEGYGRIPSEIAANILHFFEEFFDVEYSMHKMDSVAIFDFPAGAMENWGLNIYKDAYLLYSPIQNNERDRRGVALTLNHELAHQWAGNLITFDWWTMAWLNEGFATYLSYQGMQYTNPEYEPQKALQYDCIHNAMRNDVLDNSHPTVLPEKGNPWDTMTYNTNLVYSKGAALLRMMEGFLTLGTLQKGLQTYMKAFSFQAANQDQLFQILTEQANADNRLPVGATVKDIMDTWTLQKGFPLVRVAAVNDNSVHLTQENYKPDNETRTYYIPVAIATQSQPDLGNTVPKYWLFQQPNGIMITHNTTEWIVVNSGGTGYYRVEYDTGLTERLQNQLVANHEVISLGSRSQFMEDYLTFAFDRGVEIETALGFTKYLSKEIEPSVWNPFFFHMSKPRRILLGTGEGDAFKTYLLPRIAGALVALNNSGADMSRGAANIFHSQLVDWSVPVENEAVMTLAFNYYEQWKRNPGTNPIPPLLRQPIHCAAVKELTESNFQFALNQFQSESAASKTQIINGLACRSNFPSINKLLGVIIGTTGEIPKEYSQTVLSALASNPSARGMVLLFLAENFNRIVEYHGSPRLIASGINSLCSYYSGQADLITVNSFIALHSDQFTDEEDTRILQNAVRTLEGSIKWMQTFGTPMGKWFVSNL